METTSWSYDLVTVAYDAETGEELWVARFNGPANGQDFAYAMGLSSDGSLVYVTGTSLDGPVTDCSPSFQTVAYDIGSGPSE